MGKQKFYVVWDGVTPGIYTSWTECQLQVKGYDSAKYKSFDNREEAERAFAASPYAYIGKNAKKKITGPSTEMLPAAVIENSLAVDAACSGNPGPMEYRGVHVASRQEIFHFGPMKGTNNMGVVYLFSLSHFSARSINTNRASVSAVRESFVLHFFCFTQLIAFALSL